MKNREPFSVTFRRKGASAIVRLLETGPRSRRLKKPVAASATVGAIKRRTAPGNFGADILAQRVEANPDDAVVRPLTVEVALHRRADADDLLHDGAGRFAMPIGDRIARMYDLFGVDAVQADMHANHDDGVAVDDAHWSLDCMVVRQCEIGGGSGGNDPCDAGDEGH
jgi:hypothetical protein